MMIQAI